MHDSTAKTAINPARAAQAAADAWNREWPVGTPVSWRTDDGTIALARTSTPAFAAWGMPRVRLVGWHGSIWLPLVTPLEVEG
jgi:hypothetical protein